ncbi:hypothetical protein MTR_5g082135 [Medicago truncatula]|uniref:Uncharacterized protein n=1 Tax=Medicago truncatula TaxID=3880 RepID=A0A072UQZ5_MEDTR|nr:hypothetical protein MTR_5g082135 [Medicago truncatula]
MQSKDEIEASYFSDWKQIVPNHISFMVAMLLEWHCCKKGRWNGSDGWSDLAKGCDGAARDSSLYHRKFWDEIMPLRYRFDLDNLAVRSQYTPLNVYPTTRESTSTRRCRNSYTPLTSPPSKPKDSAATSKPTHSSLN